MTIMLQIRKLSQKSWLHKCHTHASLSRPFNNDVFCWCKSLQKQLKKKKRTCEQKSSEQKQTSLFLTCSPALASQCLPASGNETPPKTQIAQAYSTFCVSAIHGTMKGDTHVLIAHLTVAVGVWTKALNIRELNQWRTKMLSVGRTRSLAGGLRQ